MFDLIIRDANLPDGRKGMDIAVSGGLIAAVEKTIEAPAGEEIMATNRLVSPPFIDPHFHMDATLSLGLPRMNVSGTLLEGIALWGELRPIVTKEELVERALRYCDLAVSQDDSDRLDKIARRSVFEAACTRRIGRDRAADLTAPLGRIGRIKKPFGLDRFLQIAENNAGLDDGDHLFAVDRSDLVQPFERDDDAAERHCSADGSSSRTGDRQTNAGRIRLTEDLRDLSLAGRK